MQLRQDYPDVPIVCASIYEPTYNDVEALQAITYLLKPFTLVQLTDALQLALAQLTGPADGHARGTGFPARRKTRTATSTSGAGLDAESILGHPDHAVGERTNG